MSSTDIRTPQQKRSIEKKNKIIKAGYMLFSEKGYYNTNTVEIAQLAGVSTGIVYNYFKNKKDILIEVFKYYISSFEEQFTPLLETSASDKDFPKMIEKIMDIIISSHVMNINVHNEFLALALLESDVRALFDTFEENLLEKLHDILISYGFPSKNLPEKVKIIYGLINHACHEIVKLKESEAPTKQTILKSITIQAVMDILKS